MTARGIWSQRASTLRAMVYLIAARAAVRLLSLRAYRWSLGSLLEGSPHASTGPALAPPSQNQLHLAGRIARAAMRLPGESKCLAQAIALHWILRRSGEDSVLVIAIHRSERSARHAYHAWLEFGEVMLVGACERADYRELMRFAFEPLSSAEFRVGAA